MTDVIFSDAITINIALFIITRNYDGIKSIKLCLLLIK